VFTTGLFLEAGAVEHQWIIQAALIWTDAKFGMLSCPRGFITDLASIPEAFRNIPFIDPDGLSRRPAAMHDWLYAWRGIGKDDADEFLRVALLAEGCTPAAAATFYLGVHVFGQSSWDSDAGELSTIDFAIPGSYEAWRASLVATAA
jgi:hypothetical protein